MPAKPFSEMKDLALAMNFWRDSDEATIFEKYAEGKFQPPTERITFGPWLTKVAIESLSLLSTVIRLNSVESVHDPYGAEAQ
jgi:hypothetical protein